MARKQGQPKRRGQPASPGSGRHHQPEDSDGLRLPKSLIQDMASLQQPPHRVPEYMDDAIGEAAWEHFEGIRHRRGIRFWGGVGVAAAVVFLLFWAEQAYQHRDISHGGAQYAAGKFDVDRSGRVDILDAFSLARYVDRGGEYAAKWDFNGDGSLDKADIDAAARSAVSLSKEAS